MLNTLNYDEKEEGPELEETYIRWSNLIFLPFNPVFKCLVITMVIIKTIIGPIQSVYPIIYCWNTMEISPTLSVIKFLYLYCCDPVYGVDTFLHILHRQVTDEAMRKEYLPKPAFLLLLDIISLIPFFRLTTEDICPPQNIWPNVLAFSEFVIVYRVANYFSLITTHKFINMLFGFIIMLAIIINCVTCFLLLLTSYGLCQKCHDGNYDWRIYIRYKLNETDTSYSTYVYAAAMILAYVVSKQLDDLKPTTWTEYIVISILMISGNLLLTFIVFPKMVAEALLKYRRICTFYPQVQRIIEETERRNPSPKAHIDVKNFYELIWKKRSGITCIPELISELPRYLRVEIRQDLVWPVFYHSPTLRKTSSPFKRWLCDHVRLDYKLPGEKFFAGPHCHSHLYYLKSGIVQLVSFDDGSTPLISVTSGTIFGDISFFIPPARRKVAVRCLTYCEVLFIARVDILEALHKYPEDRQMIMHQSRERIKHAHTLYNCKKHVRGLDRSEDEGIAWVKRRWWEISEALSNRKNECAKKEGIKCDLPAEETAYHCAKFIGQLVLCSEFQLQMKSMFANVKFPWIFVPESVFNRIWRKIVIVTAFEVLLLYPPYITRNNIPIWFYFFQFWTDIIYIFDICVVLMTAIVKYENKTDNFAAVMFARCKSITFILDVLAALWIENILFFLGLPQYYMVCQFNRLLKIYVLFTRWNINKDPLYDVCYKIALIHFTYIYITSYVVFVIDRREPKLTTSYFFGELFCGKEASDKNCDIEDKMPIYVVLAWALEYAFFEYIPKTLLDIYVAITISCVSFCVFVYCKTRLVASLYLRHREKANYQYFVSNIKNHYAHHTIHPDLLKRLNKYLICHWKYYNGMDVMHPNLLKNEPYDIYWKVHGEIAEKVIRESQAFISADSSLIRELAYKAKFLILPESSTLILFGLHCKTVSWIVQGSILCEYLNEDGELLRKTYYPGELLTAFGVFFGSVSIRTLSANTECEILYIKLKDFKTIMRHYPKELAYLEICIDEFALPVDALTNDYITKHNIYLKYIRTNIFHARKITAPAGIPVLKDEQKDVKKKYWLKPDSCFMQYWMLFRVIIVGLSIYVTALQGGSGAPYRWPLIIIEEFCNFVALADIIIKMFLGYYDQRGLLITSLQKSIKHYMCRGFILDVIGCVPFEEILNLALTKRLNPNDALLINMFTKYAHLYLVMGYFNYIADMPNVNFMYLMILKWQIVTMLVLVGASHFFVSQCIEFEWGYRGALLGMTRREMCWLPNYLPLDKNPTIHQLHLVSAESLNLAQSGLMRFNLGKFQINRKHLGVGITLFVLGFLFWYVMCYSLTLLVLNHRGNTLFQHGVNQLKRFLKAERVDDSLIKRAVAHFRYWWVRTKGINIQSLMNERIGVIFRQDLSYYFFKKTVEATDTLLQGGKTLERELASASTQLYFLPGEQIIREMDLSAWVFIVHRGKIMIKKHGEDLVLLTKGGIFGQLDGGPPRPLRITAVSNDFADLLQIPLKEFQEMINDRTKENIAQNPESKYDYMAVKKMIVENPYNTVKYLLRGRKAIKLPWMRNKVKANPGTWYSRWLYLTWMIGPVVSGFSVLILINLPIEYKWDFTYFLLFWDLIHLLYIASEFFSTELVVENGKCVDKVLKWRLFKKWRCYIDISSLVILAVARLLGCWHYGLLRLLRLHLLYDFHKHFCKGFQSTIASVLLKFIIVFFTLHCMTCGWIFVACRGMTFPLKIPELPPHINATVDYTEWTTPDKRNAGCARLSRYWFVKHKHEFGFLVPIYWAADYIVAMLYIIIIYTHAEIDVVVALDLKQIYYKLFVNFIVHPLEIWILSIAISAVYTRFRELYAYDYDVHNLTTYLQHSGLSPMLLDSVREYTNQLWQRQRGNWLPELAQQAPHCLREDLLGALYLHHLQTAPLFRDLPEYFNRQLVARLRRVVVFPGKFIIQEGDIFSLTLFIHEGEVEKWYIDKNGERKLLSVLETNGYFGLIPGLFPNTPFQFSYFSRTVVDIVFLRFKDWQDLLQGYPDIKSKLYNTAKQYIKDSMI